MPEPIQDIIDRVSAISTWLYERWAIATLPPWWMIALFAALMLALVLYGPTWHKARHGATIIHEMGHVAMGWLWGRKVQGISLHSDTSGLTLTSGKGRGLGVLMTFLAGYPAPALLGLGLIWASVSGYSGAALTLVMALLALAFLLVRNFFGFLILTVSLIGAGTVFWHANPPVVTGFTLAVGIFMLLAGTRTCFDLRETHRHGKGGESDAEMASQHSLLPASAWVYIFIGASLACVAQSITVISLATL